VVHVPLSTEFYENRLSSFCVILTNLHNANENNLVGGRNNEEKVTKQKVTTEQSHIRQIIENTVSQLCTQSQIIKCNE